MSRPRWSLEFAVVALTLLTNAVKSAPGRPIYVVSPSEYADQEADSFFTNPATDGRFHQVFPATDFLSLPPDYRLITEIAWRPDGNLESALSITFDRLVYRLSTTDAAPLDLSWTFADNIGPDETVVFDGPATVSIIDIGPPGGPMEFDTALHLQTPFEYDPNRGNLLLDETWEGVSLPVSYDFVGPPEERSQLIAAPWNPSSPVASEEYGGAVWRFTFERLPGAGPLLRAGDADQDLDFDQLDLVRVQQAGKYLTGKLATWGEGDWNVAPGGRVGDPPSGDGVFDQKDIIAAMAPGHYLSGLYAAATSPTGDRGLGDVELIPMPVPEPGSITLLGLGLVGVLLLRRR